MWTMILLKCLLQNELFDSACSLQLLLSHKNKNYCRLMCPSLVQRSSKTKKKKTEKGNVLVHNDVPLSRWCFLSGAVARRWWMRKLAETKRTCFSRPGTSSVKIWGEPPRFPSCSSWLDNGAERLQGQRCVKMQTSSALLLALHAPPPFDFQTAVPKLFFSLCCESVATLTVIELNGHSE